MQQCVLRDAGIDVYATVADLRKRIAAALRPYSGVVREFSRAHEERKLPRNAAGTGRNLSIVAVEGAIVFLRSAERTRACVECLSALRLSHRPLAEGRAANTGIPVDVCGTAAVSDFALRMIPSIAQSLLSAPTDAPFDSIYLDLSSLSMSPFKQQRSESCSACRPRRRPTAARFRLEARKKSKPGRYRCRELWDFGIGLHEYVNPINGMLGSSLRQNRELPFCAISQGRFAEYRSGQRTTIDWVGTAKTHADSAVVGVLEALERHAGLYPGRRNVIRTCYREVAGKAIDPREFGLYEPQTYERQPHLIRFSEDMPIDWVEGYDVRAGTRHLVPKDFVFYGEPGLIQGNSSGCATGSSKEEALLFGLLELVERDAFVMHWLARNAPRRIAVDSVQDLECRTIVARLRRAGAQIYLLDAGLDLPIPVVIAILIREPHQFGTFSLAAGASFDAREALRKALGEVAVHFHGFEEAARAAVSTHLGLAVSG